MDPLAFSSGVVFTAIDPSSPAGSASQDNDVQMAMEEDVFQAENEPHRNHQRLIIAVNFGATFSSIAYTRLPKNRDPEHLDLRDVKCIGNYPGGESLDLLNTREDVPTELCYQSVPRSGWEYYKMDIVEDSPEHETTTYGQLDDHLLSSDEETEYEVDKDQKIQPKPSQIPPRNELWGFQVQQALNLAHVREEKTACISGFKLLLHQGQYGGTIMSELAPILKELKKKKFIKKDTDLFSHYFTHLLSHAKSELALSGDLAADVLIEFVLCVPGNLPPKGCRIMQNALQTAVEEAELGQHAIDGVSKIFMVSEPEAAATYVLAERGDDISLGETIIIIDADERTTDAVTCRVTNEDPLRLSIEVVPSDSELCGANCINERFASVLMEKLKHETYLVRNGETIQSIIDSLTVIFENNQKRKVDITDSSAVIQPIYMEDLRPNPQKGLYLNRVCFTQKETQWIFQHSLKGAKAVLKAQLELAVQERCKVQKIILTGGFSQSRGLRNYLRKYLRAQNIIANHDIELLVSRNGSTAAVRGAVLRSLNKTIGPRRVIQCSYGYLRTEPFEPHVTFAHRVTRCRINKTDGEKYVDNTIFWFIQAGDYIPNQKEHVVLHRHVFPRTAKDLICEEQLYVSDFNQESHYRKSHALNKGVEFVGSISADMTFLRDQGLIQPMYPSADSRNFGSQRKFWVVEFDLALIVEGRTLRCEVRWPQQIVLQEGQHQETKAIGQICIAAAFRPGTE